MFHFQSLNNPPTTSKLGVRPGIFKFILGSAVFVVGFINFFYYAEPREKSSEPRAAIV